MRLIFMFVLLMMTMAQGPACYGKQVVTLELNKEALNNSKLPFIPRENALALNVDYSSIPSMRKVISATIHKDLKFFPGWNINGEAHVTVLTPGEFQKITKYLPASEIDHIALKYQIQSSPLKILGLGSGKKYFGDILGETYFIIVSSENLIQIREEINKLYVDRSHGLNDFSPKDYYPHITVGYTDNDIHAPDIFKDVQHSLDKRFFIKIRRSKM